MRLIVYAFLIFTFASARCYAANKPVYFQNKGSQVCFVIKNANGKTISKPRQLTRLGKYVEFSVSHNKKWIVELRPHGPDYKMSWSVYLERPGQKPVGRVILDSCSDGPPAIKWSPTGKWLYCKGGQVEFTTIVYDFRKLKCVHTTDNVFGLVSTDQKWVLEQFDTGDVNEPAKVWVYRQSDAKVFLIGILFKDSDEYLTPVWITGTNTFLGVDSKRRSFLYQIRASGRVKKTKVRLSGNCLHVASGTKGQGYILMRSESGKQQA